MVKILNTLPNDKQNVESFSKFNTARPYIKYPPIIIMNSPKNKIEKSSYLQACNPFETHISSESEDSSSDSDENIVPFPLFK